jgi:DUF971 family protein
MSAAAPRELRRSADGDTLTATWPDGSGSVLSAAALRRACRCAACIAGVARGTPPPAGDGLTITGLAPIGDYAVTIAFSDGHARGIFPWSLLRAVAAAEPRG